MRVVFAAIPGYGHLYPLMPLAMACAAAGHVVTVAVGEPFLGRLPLPTVPGIRTGAELDGVVQETRRRHPDARGHELTVAMFGDTTAEFVSSALDEAVEDLRPDLVVYEAMNVGAAMAADVHDIPAAGFAIGMAPFVVEKIHGAAREFRRTFWAARGRVPPLGSALLGAALIDPAPPSLVSTDAGPSSTGASPAALSPIPRLPIRSVAYSENSAAVPDWLSGKRSRPAIYLTLGTVSFGAVDVIRRAVDQLAGLDVDVLVAVGPEGEPEALGDLPGHVHVGRFVPQSEVLDLVDLIVHHGGTGTVLGAMAAGLPQLILPQGADQFFNADLVARTGAGRSLLNEGQLDGAIVRAASAMLGDCPERTRADQLRLEIAGMPAPEQLVPELVRLAGR